MTSKAQLCVSISPPRSTDLPISLCSSSSKITTIYQSYLQFLSVMENEANLLVLELSRLEELFKAYLTQPSPLGTLTQEILSSLNKAKSIAKSSIPVAQQPPYLTDGTSSQARIMTKKRKILPESINQKKMVVKMGTGEGLDAHLNDGYSWRKYGRKEIQHAEYPRCYYRCNYRQNRNCQAKKRVQQSGENPSILEVTYIGTHTCYQSPQQQYREDDVLQQCLQHVCSDLTNKTDISDSDLAAPSLSFPTTPMTCLDPSVTENNVVDSFSPSLISPAMSASSYFSVSKCEMSSYGEGPRLQTEGTNFPSTDFDMDFLLNLSEYDPSLLFMEIPESSTSN